MRKYLNNLMALARSMLNAGVKDATRIAGGQLKNLMMPVVPDVSGKAKDQNGEWDDGSHGSHVCHGV